MTEIEKRMQIDPVNVANGAKMATSAHIGSRAAIFLPDLQMPGTAKLGRTKPPAPGEFAAGRLASPRAVRLLDFLRAHCTASNISQRLGNEEALAARFGVGKRTVRSAIRLLEREGIVQVSKGRDGGAFVVGKPIDRAAQMLSNHLTLTGLPLAEVKAATRFLFRLGAIAACKNVGLGPTGWLDAAVSLLERRSLNNRYIDIDSWCSMRSAIVEGAGSPVLSFLHDALQACYRDVLSAELRIGHSAYSEGEALLRLERALINALKLAELGEVRLVTRNINALEHRLLQLSLSRNLLSSSLQPEGLYGPQPLGSWAGGKLAHQTLRALHAHVREERLLPHQRLGTVGSLAPKFGVGDEVMKEAILLACRQNLVYVRRGRNGGVFVESTDDSAIRTRIAAELVPLCKVDDASELLNIIELSNITPFLCEIFGDILEKYIDAARLDGLS